MACDVCRAKKVKCDSLAHGCTYCKSHGVRCTYQSGKKRRRATISGDADRQNRLRRMESLFKRLQRNISDGPDRDISSGESADGYPDDGASFHRSPSSKVRRPPTAVSESLPESTQQPKSHLSEDIADRIHLASTAVTRSPFVFSSVGEDDLLDSILWKPAAEQAQEDNSILVKHNDYGYEFTGASSGISVLSNNGLDWIYSKTDDDESIGILRDFTVDITSHFGIPKTENLDLNLPFTLDRSLNPLPEPRLARKYVDAYFDDVQSLMPLVSRPEFEDQLENFLDLPSTMDIPWYALYNAILAMGCRVLLSRESPVDSPASFERVEKEAGKYFENTLSVQPELTYRRTSLVTVQAFVAMTIYAQQLTSPQCEFKFCSTGVRLAQGMGMHKRPHPTWALSKFEMEERNRVFWILYYLDKTIALRMGRPSAIDDVEVSCPFPTTVTGSAPGDPDEGSSFNFFLFCTRYARICSKIIRSMYSATALVRPLDQQLDTAQEIEACLEKWRQTIPVELRPGRSLRKANLPPNVPLIQPLVLHFFYYYAVCAVYRRFSARTLWGQGIVPTDTADIHKMQEKAAQCLAAARSMTLMTNLVDIQSHTPGWLLIYYPLTAIITLFTNVVAGPLSASASNDIALMEVVTGLFGRLEFCTSGGMAFTKTKEFSRLARIAVEKAKSNGDPNRRYSSRHSTQEIPRSSESPSSRRKSQSTIPEFHNLAFAPSPHADTTTTTTTNSNPSYTHPDTFIPPHDALSGHAPTPGTVGFVEPPTSHDFHLLSPTATASTMLEDPAWMNWSVMDISANAEHLGLEIGMDIEV